ncbi:hypothetical protein ACLH1Q_06840 [Klebsiella sp. 1SOBk8mer]|uniref:hypothetical protein n=1 Tax=Klebsiella TaxID=570 RepID=UPI001E6221F0|nr:hypothetical protein [Klebsiella variicola]MCE0392400.1 hypothetical protein [Klebsiella variicola subsp. variicola]HBX3400932.1 hypothetical protein [Klebsiella pneumoniae]
MINGKKFDLVNFWIDSFELTPTDVPTKTGQQFHLDATSSVFYSDKNQKDFRLTLSIELHKDKKFIFKACQMAIISFEEDTDLEQATKAISNVGSAKLLYPYLRAFTIATLKLAGHDKINIPVLMFDD